MKGKDEYPRWIIIAGITFILILLTASILRAENVESRGEEYWNSLNRFEKISLVEGFVLGSYAFYASYSHEYPEFEQVLQKYFSNLKGWSIGEIVDQVDLFYQETEGTTPIFTAILVRFERSYRKEKEYR